MALTPKEEERLTKLEKTVADLARVIKGAGSTNQMNRLYVLGQQTNNELEQKVSQLETEVETLLVLARKLQ